MQAPASVLRRSWAVFIPLDILFTIFVFSAFTLMLRLPAARWGEVALQYLPFLLLKTVIWNGVLLASTAPIERWRSIGAPAQGSVEEIRAAGRAASLLAGRMGLSYGIAWSLHYALFAAYLLQHDGLVPLQSETPIALGLLVLALAGGGGGLALPLAAWAGGPWIGAAVSALRARGTDLGAPSSSLRRRLPVLALALALAPTLWMGSLFLMADGHGRWWETRAQAESLRSAIDVVLRDPQVRAGGPESLRTLLGALSPSAHPFVLDRSHAIADEALTPTLGASSPLVSQMRSAQQAEVAFDESSGVVTSFVPLGDGRVAGIAFLTSERPVAGTLMAIAVFLLTVIVWSFVIAALLLSNLVSPLVRLSEAAARVTTGGDLTQTVDVVTHDEVGAVSVAFEGLLKRLRDLIAELRTNSALLAEAVAALHVPRVTHAEANRRIATGLAETSVTVQEIRQTSTIAASSAERVLQIAARAEKWSASGTASVDASLHGLGRLQTQVEARAQSMQGLLERAARIGGIIGRIKSLADTSHLLALNAALEASRAGEAGRAFGVVAKEIRALADQSIRSTTDSTRLLHELQDAIGAVVDESREGNQRMEASLQELRTSGESLREITVILGDTSGAVRQIAAAVSQQNAGISQISVAVRDLNTAMEETTDALQAADDASDALARTAQGISATLGTVRA